MSFVRNSNFFRAQIYEIQLFDKEHEDTFLKSLEPDNILHYNQVPEKFT